MTHAPQSLVRIGALAALVAMSAAGQVRSATDEDAVAAPTLSEFRAAPIVFRSVASALRPSLVSIETVGGTQPGIPFASLEDDELPEERRRPSNFQDTAGSRFVVADGPTTGLVYSEDGYLITSSFNFVRDPSLITVTLHDGRRMAADLIARDRVRKIALLKIPATDLVVPAWADPADLHVGQWTIALGLGFGGNDPSITTGTLSATNRMLGNAVQTDAKLGPANYGGPVCDIEGRVIGIAVPMAQRPGELAGIDMYDSGVGFAVPADRVREIAEVLKTGQSFYRGWLGMQSGGGRGAGVAVGRIANPSPLYEAGVETGDVITAIEGKPIRGFRNLVQQLYMLPAGSPVHLCLERDGVTYDVDIQLARNTELGELLDTQQMFDVSDPGFDEPDDGMTPE